MSRTSSSVIPAFAVGSNLVAILAATISMTVCDPVLHAGASVIGNGDGGITMASRPSRRRKMPAASVVNLFSHVMNVYLQHNQV